MTLHPESLLTADRLVAEQTVEVVVGVDTELADELFLVKPSLVAFVNTYWRHLEFRMFSSGCVWFTYRRGDYVSYLSK